MASLPCRDCGRPIQVPQGYTTAWHGDCLQSVRLAWMDATELEREQLLTVANRIKAGKPPPGR